MIMFCLQGPSLAGMSCTGNVFKGDDNKCSKYYLCLNGNWMQLECPKPLHWHKVYSTLTMDIFSFGTFGANEMTHPLLLQNHCDWPEKAQCRTKSSLRLAGLEPEETQEDKPIVGCYFTNWAFYR